MTARYNTEEAGDTPAHGPMAGRPCSDQLAGRVALITGAAGEGLGRALAVRCLTAGATVILTDVNADRLAEVRSALGEQHGNERVLSIMSDVSDFQGADRMVADVAARAGTVDVLINSAAINAVAPLADVDITDAERVLRVNVLGSLRVVQACVPGMRRIGRGAVVNIGSTAAFAPPQQQGIYAASKAALHALTRALSSELAPSGIRVNAIAPGPIDSPFVRAHVSAVSAATGPIPLGRFAGPAEIADVACFLASDGASYVTGEVVTVAGGWQPPGA